MNTNFLQQSLAFTSRGLQRRSFLRSVSATAVAAGTLSFRDVLGVRADELQRQGMSLIVLWMQGGPSQFETFDPKPGTPNGGETTAISTAVPGIQIASDWPQTAKVMNDIAIIRSMTNKEGQHQRATYQLHTGYVPTGTVRHPSLGCAIAKEIATPGSELPAVVSIGGAPGAGFLGVDYEPFEIPNPGSLPRNVAEPVAVSRMQRRGGLLSTLDQEFAGRGAQQVVESHAALYAKTRKLVESPKTATFEFSGESPETIAAYGDSQFGKGCLLARRLVEAGVTYIEVRSGGWDTHDDVFQRVSKNASEVDPAMATLITDLKTRGLLDRTLVLWMGEFGRTPRVNPRGGRDHYPRVFNMAMAGAGVRGGQVIGKSTADGAAIDERPVTVPDLFSTVCTALKVNPRHENLSPLGRPLKIVDGGEPVKELLG